MRSFQEVTSWDTIFDNPESTSKVPKPTPESMTNILTEDDLRRDFALYRAGGKGSQLLLRCHDILSAIPPTSVQPERDFSVLNTLLSKNRASFKSETLNDMFLLKKAFQSGAL